MADSIPKAFIFMKVGDYGSECLDGILDRKNCELKGSEKMIFWGYGGTVLNPETQVQPFVKRWIKKQKYIEVLMSRTKSNPHQSDYLYTEHRKEKYSEDKEKDKKNWRTVPLEITTDSKYALVLDKIKPCHFHLDLQDFKVGFGRSKGTNAAEYIKGHVDKGCLVKTKSRKWGQTCITYRARLIDPYAVFLE